MRINKFFTSLSSSAAALTSICALTLLIASASYAEDEVYDPIESVNRGIYSFNDSFDTYFFSHVAYGYDSVTPDGVQTGVTNFFKNLKYPTYLLSDLLQGELTQSAEHTARFVINSTVGVLGIFDFATDWGFPDKEEDFGLAFASYGVPAGPYIVLPFMGPSNLRDTVGLVLDTITNPLYFVSIVGNTNTNEDNAIIAASALKFVQQRVNLDDAIKASKEGSLDPYSFLQSSYYQYRNAQIAGENPQYRKGSAEAIDQSPANDQIDRDMDEILKGQ